MRIPASAGRRERTGYYAYRILCGLVLFFLVAPILAIVPLSFNAEPYFTFTREMLSLDPDGFSLRWYKGLLYSDGWLSGIRNSLLIAIVSTSLATVLGTMAAFGLSRPSMPCRNTLMALLVSPIVVPMIISASGMFFFYSSIGLTQTFTGIILAHTALGTPFVLIAVMATLVHFDETLVLASASLGASPLTTFARVTMPLIAPGVIAGAVFAFVMSLNEVVIAYFIAGPAQQTIPLKMFSGLREELGPTVLAMASILIVSSIVLLATLELIRRRNERLRGVVPS